MKKLLLLILLVTGLTHATTAQIRSGARLIEGSFNISQTTSSTHWSTNGVLYVQDIKSQQINVSPRLGFLINETFLIGIGIRYVHQRSENVAYTQTSNVYELSPYVRKYIALKENLYLTISGNTYFGIGTGKYSGAYEGDTDIRTFGVSITPGFTYFLDDRWAIAATFSQLYYDYRRDKQSIDPSDQYNSTSKSYGLSLQFNTFSVGVQYFLRNNKE